jgi:uncharacterized protein (TIGR02996 family)
LATGLALGQHVGVASNPRLEALIESAPDDPQNYRVYGDWLQSQGDPRGELIALQLALEEDSLTDSQKRARTIAERALLDTHAAELLGPVKNNDKLLYVTWHRGFFREVSNRNPRSNEVSKRQRKNGDLPRMLANILDHPSARFVREIRLEPSSALPLAAILDVLKSRRLPLLQTAGVWTGSIDAAGAEKLYATLPEIRHLALECFLESLGRIALPELRSLRIGDRPPLTLLDDLVRAHVPKLEALRLERLPGDDSPGYDKFFEGRGLPSLRRFRVQLAEDVDDHIVQNMLGSSLIERLVGLELGIRSNRLIGGSGRLGNVRRLLVTNVDRLRHLQQLRLSPRLFDRNVADQLRRELGDRVSFGLAQEDG